MKRETASDILSPSSSFNATASKDTLGRQDSNNSDYQGVNESSESVLSISSAISNAESKRNLLRDGYAIPKTNKKDTIEYKKDTKLFNLLQGHISSYITIKQDSELPAPSPASFVALYIRYIDDLSMTASIHEPWGDTPYGQFVFLRNNKPFNTLHLMFSYESIFDHVYMGSINDEVINKLRTTYNESIKPNLLDEKETKSGKKLLISSNKKAVQIADAISEGVFSSSLNSFLFSKRKQMFCNSVLDRLSSAESYKLALVERELSKAMSQMFVFRNDQLKDYYKQIGEYSTANMDGDETDNYAIMAANKHLKYKGALMTSWTRVCYNALFLLYSGLDVENSSISNLKDMLYGLIQDEDGKISFSTENELLFDFFDNVDRSYRHSYPPKILTELAL